MSPKSRGRKADNRRRTGTPSTPEPRRPLFGRAFDRPDPAAIPAHVHAHWHFWRLEFSGNLDLAAREIPVDTFYARDVFATAAEAAEAVAEDVVIRYPDAKRLDALAQFVAVVPDNTGSTFSYTKPSGLYVLWGLLGCNGDCEAVISDHGTRLTSSLETSIKHRQG